MKKSTGIVFLVAAALAAFIYLYEVKYKTADDPLAIPMKPAFPVASAADITEMKLSRNGVTVVFEHRDDGWYVVQPVKALADQSIPTAIASAISIAQVYKTIPTTADNLASYGLAKPTVSIEFTVKSGAKHKVQLGTKDFTGGSVYALVDETKDVSLLSMSILSSSDIPLDDIRDHSVLNLTASEATSFDLTNESGTISLVKNGDVWRIEKPRGVAADSSTVQTILQVIQTARAEKPVDLTPAGLPKYGLSNPTATFRLKLPDGKSGELQIGKKEGDEYYARDVSRPTIFLVNSVLHDTLMTNFSDLRDRTVVHFSEVHVERAEVRNENGTTICVRDSEGNLVIQQPAGKQVDPVSCPIYLSSLTGARAQEIYDKPSGDIAAMIARPAVQITATDDSGKSTNVRLSGVSGQSVYVQTDDAPEVYKVDRHLFDAFNFKTPNAKSSPSVN